MSRAGVADPITTSTGGTEADSSAADRTMCGRLHAGDAPRWDQSVPHRCVLFEVLALHRDYTEDQLRRVSHVDTAVVFTDSDRPQLLEPSYLCLRVVGFDVEVDPRFAVLKPLVREHLTG